MSNIQSNLEALSEDEGLTDNLTDAPARAVLAWAEQHIKAGHDLASVRRAVRAANRNEFDSSEAAVAAASAALGAGAGGVAAAPKASPSAVDASQSALDAAVSSGIAAATASAGMFSKAVTALRGIGAAGLAAAANRSISRTRRPRVQSRRSRKSRFSTRRP